MWGVGESGGRGVGACMGEEEATTRGVVLPLFAMGFAH